MNNNRHTSPTSIELLVEDILTRYDKFGFPSEANVYDFNRAVYRKHGYGIPLDPNMISGRKELDASLKNKKIPQWMKEMPELVDANNYEQREGKRKNPSGEDGKVVIGIFDVNPPIVHAPPEKRQSLQKPPNEKPVQNQSEIVVEPDIIVIDQAKKRRSDPKEKRVSLGAKPMLQESSSGADPSQGRASDPQTIPVVSTVPDNLFQVLAHTKEISVLELEKTIQDQKKQINNQSTQIEIGNLMIQEREMAIIKLKREVEQLKSQAGSEAAARSALLLNLETDYRESTELVYQQQCNTFWSRSKELENKVGILARLLEETRTEIRKKEEERVQELSRSEKLVTQLKHAEKRRLDDIAQLEVDRNEVTALLEKKAEEHQSEKARADKLESKLRESKERIKGLENTMSSLLTKNSHLCDTVLSVKHRKSLMQKELQSLGDELTGKIQLIEGLSSDFELCKEKNALLREEMTRTENEAELLKKNLADASLSLQQTEQSNETLRTELDKLLDIERTLRSNLVALTDEIETLKDRLEEKEVRKKKDDESANLERELDEKKREIVSLKEKLADSRMEANDQESTMESECWPSQQIQDAINDLKTSVQKKNEEIRSLKENLGDQENKLALRLTLIVQKDGRILQLNKMAKKKDEELESLQSEVEKRELKISEMEKSLETKEQIIEGLKGNNRDVIKKNIVLQRLRKNEAEKIQAAKNSFELRERSLQDHVDKVREAEKLTFVLKKKELEISDLKQKRAILEVNVTEMKDNFLSLFAELNKGHEEKTQILQNEVDAKTAELRALDATNKITLEALDSMKRQSRDPRLNGTNDLLREIRDLETVQSKQKSRIDDLEAALKKAEETVKQLEARNATSLGMNAELKKAQAEIKNMDKLLADSDVTVQDLATKVGELEKEKKEILCLSTNKEHLFVNLKKNLEESAELNASLRSSLSKKEHSLHYLTDQMATLRARNEKRIAGLLTDVAKNSNLEGLLRERNELVASLQEKVENFKSDLKTERDRMAKMDDEKEKLFNVEKASAVFEVATLQKKIQSLEEVLMAQRDRQTEQEAASLAKKGLEESIANLQKTLEEKELSVNDLTTQLTTVRKENDDHVREIADKQTQLDSLNGKVMNLKAEQKEMAKTLHEKEMLLNILKNSSTLEVQTLQETIQSLETMLDSSSENNSDDLKKLEKRIQELMTELTGEWEKRKEFEAQLASLQALNAVIEKQNAEVGRKLEEAAVKSKKRKDDNLMLKKKVKDLETELFGKNERLIGQEKDVKQLQDEIVVLKKKALELVLEKELTDQEVSKRLQDELTAAKDLVKELENRMGQTDGIRLEKEKQLEDLRRLLEESKRGSSGIWTAENQECLTDFWEKIVVLRLVIADKNAYIASLDAIRGEPGKMHAMREAFSQCQRDLKEKNDQLGHLTRRLANKNEEVDALKRQCQSLEQLRATNEPSLFLPTPDSNQRPRKRKRSSKLETHLRPLLPAPREETVNLDRTITIED